MNVFVIIVLAGLVIIAALVVIVLGWGLYYLFREAWINRTIGDWIEALLALGIFLGMVGMFGLWITRVLK